MPPKAGIWDNADFLMDLTLALYQIASQGGALNTQAKGAVQDYLKRRGHDQTWESIRMTKWDAQAHEDMLLCIFKHCDLSGDKMAKVLADMHAKGYTFTENAFRSQYFGRHFPIQAVMSEKPVRGWNANSHEALLFALIEEFKPNKEKITKITERLQKMGYTYTFHAVNQHVQKLRKQRDISDLDGAAGSSGSKPSTPRKRATPSKKRKVNPDEDAEDFGVNKFEESDDFFNQATPVKLKADPDLKDIDWKKAAYAKKDVGSF